MHFLLLEDENATKAMIISADIFAFDPDLVSLIRGLLAPWGIPPEGIILNASHTTCAPGTLLHAAPLLGKGDADYVRMLANAVQQGMELLYAELGPCAVAQAHTAIAPGTAQADPATIRDPHLAILGIDFSQSGQRVLVVNHGCHPAGRLREARISPGFLGNLRKTLMAPGDIHGVMFLQGATANTSPVLEHEGRWHEATSLAETDAEGQRLALAVRAALAQGTKPVHGPLACTRRTLSLPAHPIPALDALQAMAHDLQGDPLQQQWAQNMLDEKRAGQHNELACEVQGVALGPTCQLLSLTGELSPDVGSTLRGLVAQPASLFLLGCTNGMTGSAPGSHPAASAQPCPPPANLACLLPAPAEAAGAALLQGARECLAELADPQATRTYGRQHLEPRRQDAFFVLSADCRELPVLRDLLAVDGESVVHLCPCPTLAAESLAAWRGELEETPSLEHIRRTLLHQAWHQGHLYGEINPDLLPFGEALALALPESKFVLLACDPCTFVRSAMQRQFYTASSESPERIRPATGSAVSAQWADLNPFAKSCWLWAAIYRRALETAKAIGMDRVHVARIEDLLQNPDGSRELFRFLGLTHNQARVSELLAAPARSEGKVHFPPGDSWPPELLDTLDEHCSEVAEALGYDLQAMRAKLAARSAGLPPGMTSLSPSWRPPTVCVGLPVYSGGDMLAGAIESILAQDFEDLQLIVMDLGSDPGTRETCLQFGRFDTRLQYVCTGDDIRYLGIRNLAAVLEFCRSPYFMWGSYDDRHAPNFVSRCLEVLERDDSVGISYPRCILYNARREVIDYGHDTVHADQDDPLERFRHVIWELDLCTAFYGIFRTRTLRKTRSSRWRLFRSYDCLLLAEMALLGKIVQIPDLLFHRTMTRKKTSLGQNNMDVLRSNDPGLLDEGLSLPFCRDAYAHCEIVNYSRLDPDQKERMTAEIRRCFRARWDNQMRFEILRALESLKEGHLYRTWDERTYDKDALADKQELMTFHAIDLLKHLSEALFLYPEWQELRDAYHRCLAEIGFHPSRNVRDLPPPQEPLR